MPVPIARGSGAPPSDSARRSAAFRAVTLGIGERVEGRRFDRRQEIAERGERQPRFGRRRPARQHAISLVGGMSDSRPPHGRLADTGIALEHEARKAVSSGNQQRVDGQQLGLAAEHRSGHGGAV